jgi:metallo-beta-lactamase family protein
MKLQFLGASRQVTGSRYLLDAGGLRLMIDCGMFQEREFLERNWAEPVVSASSVNFLLLTHAHLDHSGLIPKFVRDGFRGRIVATGATRDLADIILNDSAQIQAEDAEFKRRRHELEHRKGPHPVQPLYTQYDVTQSLALFQKISYRQPLRLNDAVTVTYFDAGHILGSAMIRVDVQEGGTTRSVLFSGDIGQWDKPIIRDPSLLDRADYVVMESTYGDRDHQQNGGVEDQLAKVINETVERGGNLLIPTFAVERAQELIYHVRELTREDRIPNLMVFLDSPMAVDATEVFLRHRECLDAEALRRLDSPQGLFSFSGLRFTRSASESKAINRIRGTCIILASSGMCNAGRIKHHLARHISRPESTVLLTGYQAHGTLGREISEGAPRVRIHGQFHDVRARVDRLYGLSAHGDRSALLKWIGHMNPKPGRVFLTHGEAGAMESFAKTLREQQQLNVDAPEYLQTFEL